MTAALSQPIKWHGGKHYLADRIIALMPPHVHYVEPYFGGGAVLLAKDPNGISEVVNDIDGELINFWNVLRSDDFDDFKRACEATPCSELLFDQLRREDPTGYQSPVRRAWRFFILCRQSRAATFRCFTTLAKTRTRRGMNELPSAWLTAIEGLPAIHARLKRVVILNRDALEVIRTQDGSDTLFYLDPPYLHETRTTPDAYANEMSKSQHEAMLRALIDINGKFLLSGYRSTLYDEVAKDQGWNRHDFELPNNSAGGKEKRRMTECVWCNF